MRRLPIVLLLAGLGLSSQVVPRRGAVVPTPESIDSAFSHALLRARGIADKLETSFEHGSWDDPWIISSNHYELRTTASRAYGVRMINTLESMLPIYQQLLDTTAAPRTPVPVLIHPTADAYRQYGDDHSDERSSIWGGFFDPNNPDGSIAAVYDSNEKLERMYLVYASCQQFVHQAFDGPSLPTPLAQGLSAYAQAFWEWDFLLARFKELLGSGELIPLADLLSAERGDYVTQKDRYLVQLAVTFTYLRAVREDTRSKMRGVSLLEAGPFDQYLRKVVRGESVRRDPIHILLTTKLDELDKEIRDWAGR